MQNGPWQNFNWRFYSPIHPWFFCRTNLQPSNPKETTFSAGHLSIFVQHQLILSVLPQKLMDLAWWCMKASCRGGDKAIEGAGQNGGNGCIRRLTIEAGSAHADHARSYIHLSEVCAPSATQPVFQSRWKSVLSKPTAFQSIWQDGEELNASSNFEI